MSSPPRTYYGLYPLLKSFWPSKKFLDNSLFILTLIVTRKIKFELKNGIWKMTKTTIIFIFPRWEAIFVMSHLFLISFVVSLYCRLKRVLKLFSLHHFDNILFFFFFSFRPLKQIFWSNEFWRTCWKCHKNFENICHHF